jgi:hypothetical protein
MPHQMLPTAGNAIRAIASYIIRQPGCSKIGPKRIRAIGALTSKCSTF